MRVVRGIVLTLALALVGAAGGYGLGVLNRTEPTTFATARPVPAQSPSIPVLPTPPYADDIDYPALQPDLEYRSRTIGDPPYQWAYAAPRGWVRTTTDVPDEFNWRPRGEPPAGGYRLRVKLVTERKTTQAMVDQKAAAVSLIYDDVEIVDQSEDWLYFTYREPTTNTKRYDMFRWFAAPGGTETDVEMSVVGREVDEAGLFDLLDHVAASVHKLP